MKIKSHKLNPHVLSSNQIKSLGFSWKELFNPSNAIHTNREINMSNIKMIGFDMDYTLAIYKKRPMETLQYELAKEYLIKNFSYPEQLKKYNFDAQAVIRGLVIDKNNGTILKLDDQNTVRRAFHGKKQLTYDEINDYYSTKRIKLGDTQFYSLDTFFSIPEACLFVDVINLFYEDEKNSFFKSKIFYESETNFSVLFDDIRNAMDTIHSNGSLKGKIVVDIDHYIEHNHNIFAALNKLKHDGKKLFLLTNSSYEYTETVLSHVFGQNTKLVDWHDVFDVVIVDAKKPSFFTGNTPFSCPIKSHKIHEKIMSGGNIKDFHRLCNVHGPQVLFVGDHIYGDIMRSKKDSSWRTCLIIKELNFDIKNHLKHEHYYQELKQIYEEQKTLDRRLMRLRTLRGLIESGFSTEHGQSFAMDQEIKTQIKSLTHRLLYLKEKYQRINRMFEDTFHPTWGRLFREDQELSLFGAFVRQYACIYTDHVSNFLRYGANHSFMAHKELMSHEIDFD